ncbi:MAG: M28 family peptidase [Gemmatimonadales bacterium]
MRTSNPSSPRHSSPAPEPIPSWVRPLFRRVAVPRLPGSSAVQDVERAIHQQLVALGLQIDRQPFVASAAPLAAAAVLGAGLGWAALAALPLLMMPGAGWPVALVIWGALAATGMLAWGVAQGYLPTGSAPVEAANLVARRGAATPAVWLVAHLDSKGQGTSLAARVVAVPLAVVAGVGLIALGGWRWTESVPWEAVVPVVVAGLVGGAVLSRSRPSDGSAGAVDNATGVVAALVAAERLADRPDVGVLITGAEEFSMAGARAWTGAADGSGGFVNFDGIDARGRYRVMRHGRSGGGRGRQALADIVSRHLWQVGGAAGVGRLPLGIFVDGAVLARAGLSGVTVSRGDWHTLRVVHTARDHPERVDLAAAALAGVAVGAALREFLVDGSSAAK